MPMLLFFGRPAALGDLASMGSREWVDNDRPCEDLAAGSWMWWAESA